MNIQEKLKVCIHRLEQGERSQQLKDEITSLIVAAEPRDLYQIEQRLIEAGLQPSDLAHRFCNNTAELRAEMARMKAALPPSHLIHTLIRDHEIFLDVMDEIEKINDMLQAQNDGTICSDTIAKLLHSIEIGLSNEAHHKCEEEIIYPAIEKRGELGPPTAMLMEHVEVYKCLKALTILLRSFPPTHIAEVKANLDAGLNLLICIKRDHIFKEVYTIYPVALQTITNDAEWEHMRMECVRQGYCGNTAA